jgi:hypothetical protein
MTAREAYEAKKARLQADDGTANYRTSDPALRSLIDLAEESVNTGRPAFRQALAMTAEIIEPR